MTETTAADGTKSEQEETTEVTETTDVVTEEVTEETTEEVTPKNKTEEKFKKILSQRNEAREAAVDAAEQAKSMADKMKELESKMGLDEGLEDYVAEKVMAKAEARIKQQESKNSYIVNNGEELLDLVEQERAKYPGMSYDEAHVLVVGRDPSITRDPKKYGMAGNPSQTRIDQSGQKPNKFKLMARTSPKDWYKKKK